MHGVVAGEGVGAGAELGFAERIERRFDRVEVVMHVAGFGIHEEKPGDDLARRMVPLQVSQRRDPVARIIIEGEFPKA